MSDSLDRIVARSVQKAIDHKRLTYYEGEIIGAEIIELQAQLDAANELIDELGDALEDLLDHQNGCPLPKYEIPWNRAVESSRTALNKWRALKGHDDREVMG